MVESRYVYNEAAQALERYYEDPADYNKDTYQTKTACLEALSDCRFSYFDGKAWQDQWSGEMSQIPRAIKVNFKFIDEERGRDFMVNIPISP